MNTPICDFVENYNKQSATRFHMPGHKGTKVLGFEQLDITEINGADVLYDSHGIIMESQNNAVKLFGTKRTIYSTEGSSLCIRAMVYLARLFALKDGKKPRILAVRNAHKSFVLASAILGIPVDWLWPKEQSLFCGVVDLNELEEMLIKTKPTAVYLTSPDYLGNIADIRSVSDICHKHNALLMVDNAHGAYLKFLNSSLHPIDLGADLCCDSAHKTLPVLTGGAYLHISNTAPKVFCELAETAMSHFASTSPSYLILQSLDKANAYIENGFTKELKSVQTAVDELKYTLKNSGFSLIGEEPMKLTIISKEYGYSGFEMAEILKKDNLICEFADPDYIVMMFSAQTKHEEIKKIKNTLISIPKKTRIDIKPPKIQVTESVMSPNEAILSVSEWVKICEAGGRVLASPCVNCPPAIPIAICGERIGENTVKCFEYYGIDKVLCVK